MALEKGDAGHHGVERKNGRQEAEGGGWCGLPRGRKGPDGEGGGASSVWEVTLTSPGREGPRVVIGSWLGQQGRCDTLP